MIPPEIALPVVGLFGAPVAALLLGFFVVRRVAPERTHWPILASCAVVTASAFAILGFVAAGKGLDQPLVHWAVVGDWGFSFGLRIDGPSATALAMVALVGSLIHVYAASYMKGDPGFARFFLCFHLFFLAMIGLLTANDFTQMYLYWELVGVASWLLVGFWHHKASARSAALKAFLTNRVGDFGFLLALLVMLVAWKTTRMHFVYLYVLSGKVELAAIVGLGLIWAACAKSAQFPLYFWLPDAMEGPTPTSALMHAATMVTAGVFLLVRAWPVVASVPGLPELVAWIGAITALFSALVAGTKKDLKRILAYSTVSHLGLMMLALGLGQVGTAMFHLVVHGFFKAALFLCAGNIAHALHQPTASVDQVGGWRKAMPVTHASFLVAGLSLAGIWPLGGFFSKDAILDAAWHHGGALGIMGLLVAAASAFYIFRMLFLTFYGDRAEQKAHRHEPHEAEPALGAPVAVLALGSALIGFAGPKMTRALASGWTMVPPNTPILPGELALPPFSPLVAGLGTAMAALGAFAAWRLTMSDPGWDWRWRGGAAEAAFESDFGWKTVASGLASLTVSAAGFVGRVFDKAWWDGLLEGTAGAARAAGGVVARAGQGRLNDSLWWMLAGAALFVGRALR
jgi:NADH-quinone oxidoreductase subunit L